MNSAKLFNIHAQIAKIRLYFVSVLILLHLVGFAVNIWGPINTLRSAVNIFVVLLVIVDFYFARYRYFYNFRLIQIIRIPLAMWSLTNIIDTQNSYAIFLSAVFFVILLIQIVFFTDIVRMRYRLMVFLLMIMPMIILSAYQMLGGMRGKDIFQSVTFCLTLVVYVSIFIIFTSKVLAEKKLVVKELEGELDKIKQSKDSIVTTSNNDYEKLSHENSEMLIENLIQQYISSSLEITSLMKLILESLSEALVVNLCCIIVKEEQDDTYQYNTRNISNNIDLEYFNTFIENGNLITRFKNLRKPFVDNQVNTEKYDFLVGTPIQSLLVYPLVSDGEWLGMLIIGKDTSGYFEENMSFFERVSTQFSIALMNARTYTKMENMAMKDGLTGIFNRTFMVQKMNEYISDVVFNKSPLAVMLFDIDHFKNVNDTYGHLFGDEVIRVCANIAQQIAKKQDGFAVRYGGEEFVIICKPTSIEELRLLAQELHSKIKATEVAYRGSSLCIDISIGVAIFPDRCDNPAELIDRADKAMYHSKISGRGRITFDGEYTI